jgi:hypothetical protein
MVEARAELVDALRQRFLSLGFFARFSAALRVGLLVRILFGFTRPLNSPSEVSYSHARQSRARPRGHRAIRAALIRAARRAHDTTGRQRRTAVRRSR